MEFSTITLIASLLILLYLIIRYRKQGSRTLAASVLIPFIATMLVALLLIRL